MINSFLLSIKGEPQADYSFGGGAGTHADIHALIRSFPIYPVIVEAETRHIPQRLYELFEGGGVDAIGRSIVLRGSPPGTKNETRK